MIDPRSGIILFVVIYVFATCLCSCQYNQKNIGGHWYLTQADSLDRYTEMQFVSGTMIRVCRDGYYWYDQAYSWVNDSTALIKGEKYRIKMMMADTLYMELHHGTLAQFARLKGDFDPYSEKDAILFRRCKFYANRISPFDTAALNDFGYEVWALFNDNYIFQDTTILHQGYPNK